MRSTAQKGEIVPFKRKEETIEEIAADQGKLKSRSSQPKSVIELQRRWLRRIAWFFVAIGCIALVVLAFLEYRSILEAIGRYAPLRRWY